MTVYQGPSPDLTMAPSASATLFTMAESLLSMTVQLATQSGIELPSQRVIYMAPIPLDCPRVAVLIGGWVMEPITEGLTSCFQAIWTAQLGVTITRTSPAVPRHSGDAPPASALIRAAQIASADAEVLLQVVGSLDSVADVQVATPATEGGLQSVTLAFRTATFGVL